MEEILFDGYKTYYALVTFQAQFSMADERFWKLDAILSCLEEYLSI